MKYKLLKSIPWCNSWEEFIWNNQFTAYSCWNINYVNESYAKLHDDFFEIIQDTIDPKFSVWERIIYEGKNLVFFTEIKWIRILEWEVMYYLFDWFYKEENIKRASEECQDKKSKFNNIYPFL